jgi:hypothetical protein
MATFEIEAIHAESQLIGRLPDPRSLALTTQMLRSLPKTWQDGISQWRGIYYIFDRRRELGYVGAAFGRDNIWGRWSVHLKRGGDAKKLKECDPEDFVFSVLEHAARDADKDTVEALERSWKVRLHTVKHGLNDN